MTHPDAPYPACDRCGQHPRVIRHAGGTESVLHTTNLPCETVFAAYPPDHARALWRQHAKE